MGRLKQNLFVGIAGTAALASVSLGWLFPHPLFGVVGAAGLLYLFWHWKSVGRRRIVRRPEAAKPSDSTLHTVPENLHRKTVDPADTGSLIEDMLAQNRYVLLLRPQIAAKLEEEQFQRALASLEDGMALVPDGEVVIGQADDGLDESDMSEDEILLRRGRVVRVEHFFLDRYPVTNGQFQEFVAAGGYQQVSLWEPSILPAVLDFVDQTGQPGPRFWKNGCHDPHQADHPVVGVSWYEASAFARWAGKRLPTDAEWVKAASWPVSVSAETRVQRRYPWGDTMDRTKANLWGSGASGAVPVSQFAEGVSVGGVYQLIGNVWEWMKGNFSPIELPGDRWHFETTMKSIRGGAYDTYFDNHATCQFQSGEAAIARKRNIGFRCAIGVCDLVLARPTEAAEPGAEQEESAPLEVGT